jgi:RHS repeat-associated protein
VDDQGHANATLITRTTRYAYTRINGRSVLTAIDGPLANGPKNDPSDSDITQLQWDEQGNRLVAVTRPMGLTERFEHDDAGRIVALTDADGVRSLWLYGARNAVQPSATVRAGIATGYTYDALGRVNAVADTTGRGIALAYDAAGRLTSVTDAQGYRQELTLDSEGKVLRAGLFEPEELQPPRAAYRFYDDHQRLSKHLLPDGRLAAYTYDDSAQGQRRLIEHLDGDDVLHLHRRNAQGLAARIDLTPNQLVRVSLSQPLSAQQSPDSRGDARGQAPYLRRDDFARPVLQWRPEQGLQTRAFDAAGHLTQEQRRDRTGAAAGHTQQRFDLAGRLIERQVFDAQGRRVQAVGYSYQGARLASQRDDAQTTSYTYDAAGRVSSSTITLLDEQGHTAYSALLRVGLDAQGQPITKTLADRQVMRIERHAATGVASRITLQTPFWAQVHEQLNHWLPQDSAHRVQAWLPRQLVAGDIAFHPYNGLTGFTHGNGVRTDKQFDIAGRLTSMKTGEQTTRYGYGVGPRIRKIDAQALHYDGWGALKEQDTARIIKTAAANTAATINPARIEYDRQGRVVNDGISRYTFNAEGQVGSVSTQDGKLIARYRYNALRQRVSKTVHSEGSTKTTYYLWQDGKVVAEIDGSGEHMGQLSAQYVYLSEDGKAQPVAKLEAAHASGNKTGHDRALAIHANHRGEPTAMSDEHQRIVWKTSSDAWGYVDAKQTAAQDAELNIRLPGQYYDEESDLHDNWHRSYDPRPTSALKGNYLSPDPLGYPDGPDAYAYVNGDPINRVDPMGLYEEDVHYYLIVFLARVAGMNPTQAHTIGSASQFVDDNQLTTPILAGPFGAPRPNTRALPLYHFTRERGADTTTDAATRINNPGSAQLDNLRRPAFDESLTRCTRTQFFGEFIHAFADTFSHRDQNNVPFFFTGTLGHGAYNHDPDQTYNIRDFGNNEMRTMRMAQEVYEQMMAFNGGASASAWSDIEATVREFARTGRAAAAAQDRWISGSDLAYLTRKGNELRDKRAVLDARLRELGLGPLTPTVSLEDGSTVTYDYNDRDAQRRREANLRGLTHIDPATGRPTLLPGVLLPGD